MANETEIVTYRQWDSYAQRIETRTLKAKGESRTVATIKNNCNFCIIEIRPDQKVLLVLKGWREAMRQAATGKDRYQAE